MRALLPHPEGGAHQTSFEGCHPNLNLPNLAHFRSFRKLPFRSLRKCQYKDVIFMLVSSQIRQGGGITGKMLLNYVFSCPPLIPSQQVQDYTAGAKGCPVLPGPLESRRLHIATWGVLKQNLIQKLPPSEVVKIPRFQCRVCGFYPWSGN